MISPYTGQRNPHFLKKIRANICDLQAVLQPSDSLADVGCYHGHLYSHLNHADYTGIDLFGKNIAEAKRLHPMARFICADLFDLVGKWDVVFCCRVLMHLPERFEEAVRRLITCARKWTVLVLPVGEESCATELIKGDTVYFRTFAERTVRALGECRIIAHKPYHTVLVKCA